jgi:hypothetical protein
MPRKKKPEPEIEDPLTCPSCQRTAESSDYDCGGALIGCLWCNACNAHFDSVTMKLVPVRIEGETGVLFP